MAPQGIKQRFGSRICLHGAIDTQYVLPRGTPEDVRNAVWRMVAILGAGGGFILAPTHVLQTDVPTGNVLTLYETGYATGVALDR
jgi:uroporphyrinogen decarboxylase